MRIATSTVYNQQIQSIDDLAAQYANVGQQLSSGKKLQAPSDNPSVIAQDLSLTSTLASENGDVSNATAAQNQLTYTDATLSSLTDLLSKARSLAVAGASDIIPNGSQRPLIGKEVSGLLDQALALANAQYGTNYVFAGSGPRTTPPVVAQGSPPTSIIFNGNLNAQTTVINGQTVTTGTTLQDGFNYQSTDGTPDVFTLLATLRDTLDKEPASIQSAASINATGKVIYGPTSPALVQTTLGQLATAGGPSGTMLVSDNAVPSGAGGHYSIQIDGTNTSGGPGSQLFTFSDADTISTILTALNGATATTGVQASWNSQTQRVTMTSVATGSPPFNVSDVSTPLGNGVPPATTAATNTSNFRTVFEIQNPTSGLNTATTEVTVTSNLSTQLGDFDKVIDAVLKGRAGIGQEIQNLAATTNQVSALTVDNKSVQNGYEATDVASATTKFSQVQTALQSAYATTARLEGKTLFDYL